MNSLPQGVMRMAWAILKDTFGTVKKYDAISVEKPICETGNPGRYREHNGRYFAAQHPSTIRFCHGRDGEGCTLRIVSPIRRITSSALLSSYTASAYVCTTQLEQHALISNSTHISSSPGCARNSSRSTRRGIGSCGSFRVLNLLINS
jgi:hypothetical protein